jgi:uncharacterized membrane protein
MRRIAAIPLLLVAVGLIVWGGPGIASAEEGRTIPQVLGEIRQSQDLQPDQQIDCNAVTDAQFEALGEAWMDVMIPDPKRHEIMDRMMGGEGSESLATAHRMMGARYLGCIEDGSFGGMMMPGMMGGYGYGSGGYGMGYHGYAGRPSTGYAGHMMYGGGWMHSWTGNIIMWIILLIVVGLVSYGLVASSRGHRGAGTGTGHIESAGDILKKRYARGEISKEEYERMRNDIS